MFGGPQTVRDQAAACSWYMHHCKPALGSEACWRPAISRAPTSRMRHQLTPAVLLAQGSNVFAGKHGFITPRDLFRWAGRGAVGYEVRRLTFPQIRGIFWWYRPLFLAVPASDMSLPLFKATHTHVLIRRRCQTPGRCRAVCRSRNGCKKGRNSLPTPWPFRLTQHLLLPNGVVCFQHQELAEYGHVVLAQRLREVP